MLNFRKTPRPNHPATTRPLAATTGDLNLDAVIADKGYQGTGMITPRKKPAGRQLAKSDRMRNTSIDKIRWVVERANAHIKTWRILHTDYRKPLHTYAKHSAPPEHSYSSHRLLTNRQ